MSFGLDVVVDPEDPADVQEAETFATGLTPSDHLTDFRQQYEIARLEHKLAQLQAKISQEADRHALRKKYSFALFALVLIWVITVWVFIALQGLGAVPRYSHWKFKVSDTVLITYITSTTASILGLFGIAAYWLFGAPRKVNGGSSDGPKEKKKKRP